MRRNKITRKLEQLFELDSSDAVEESIVESTESTVGKDLITREALAVIEKVENALPEVRGLDTSDSELDELAKLAVDSFNNLSDLGMQVDSRFSAEIFSVAGTMLGHALSAKAAKINKKLKMIDLQLKKAELDRKLSLTKQKEPEETPLGTAQVVDRNQLIKMILENASDKNGNNDK